MVSAFFKHYTSNCSQFSGFLSSVGCSPLTFHQLSLSLSKEWWKHWWRRLKGGSTAIVWRLWQPALVPVGRLADNNVAWKPNTTLNPLSGPSGVSYEVLLRLPTLCAVEGHLHSFNFPFKVLPPSLSCSYSYMCSFQFSVSLSSTIHCCLLSKVDVAGHWEEDFKMLSHRRDCRDKEPVCRLLMHVRQQLYLGQRRLIRVDFACNIVGIVHWQEMASS